MRLIYNLVILLCVAIPGSAFPAMLFERFLPRFPTPDRWKADGSWYHYAKNVWTELIRADPQYWGKLLAFIILLYAGKGIYSWLRKPQQQP